MSFIGNAAPPSRGEPPLAPAPPPSSNPRSQSAPRAWRKAPAVRAVGSVDTSHHVTCMSYHALARASSPDPLAHLCRISHDLFQDLPSLCQPSVSPFAPRHPVTPKLDVLEDEQTRRNGHWLFGHPAVRHEDATLGLQRHGMVGVRNTQRTAFGSRQGPALALTKTLLRSAALLPPTAFSASLADPSRLAASWVWPSVTTSSALEKPANEYRT